MSSRDLIERPVDYIVLARHRSPGIAKVQGGELERRQRERQAFGVAGATIFDQGAVLCPFDVVFTLLTADDLAAWDAWRDAVLVRNVARQTVGQSIEHPVLADLGITACLFKKRTQLTQDDKGGYSVTVSFKEYRRPQPAAAVPDGARVDPQDAEIARLEAERDALLDPSPSAPAVPP